MTNSLNVPCSVHHTISCDLCLSVFVYKSEVYEDLCFFIRGTWCSVISAREASEIRRRKREEEAEYFSCVSRCSA